MADTFNEFANSKFPSKTVRTHTKMKGIIGYNVKFMYRNHSLI